MNFLLSLLDPDRDWRRFDKVQHAASGFVICLLSDAFLPLGTALLLTLWTALVYEAGQTDVAFNLRDGSGRRYAGRPGFGFGLLDIAFGLAGAGVYAALAAAL